jgi:hypothetical protein
MQLDSRILVLVVIPDGDPNQATPLQGFLALGARSVLASVFPLYALDAAAFVARLLYRVAAYLPVAVKAVGRSLTWNEVVSGMLRMQLLTDYLRQLEGGGFIDKETYLEVHKFGNMMINGGDEPPSEEPFAAVDQYLLEKCGLTAGQLKASLEVAVANSSVLSYLQLGRPETISIADGAAVQEFQAYLDELVA